MHITEEQIRELVAADSVTLPNGDILRVLIEPDYGTDLADFDCYGRTKWTRDNYLGYNVRPAMFTGRAEKITTDRGNTLWWEPPCHGPEDARQWHTDEKYRRDMRRLVRDILEYGFSVIRLELCRGEDAYGRPVVVDFTTLGGIEPFSGTDVLADYIGDMIGELSPEPAHA